jgi:branched-chain amino acid transport system ATP-binding protein
MNAPLLITKQLVKRFGGLLATDHVSLEVSATQIHALIGPNGAGKTTLIGQLTGELFADSGSIEFDGHTITHAQVDARARMGLARSYQITQVFKEFTALENVMMSVLAADSQHGAKQRGTAWGAWLPLHSHAHQGLGSFTAGGP